MKGLAIFKKLLPIVTCSLLVLGLVAVGNCEVSAASNNGKGTADGYYHGYTQSNGKHKGLFKNGKLIVDSTGVVFPAIWFKPIG